jgi:hypothetical protein
MTESEIINRLEVISRKSVLNEDEAALYMNRSVNAMRELRYKWRIPYIKDGRKIQYRRKDLDAYIEKNLVPAMV